MARIIENYSALNEKYKALDKKRNRICFLMAIPIAVVVLCFLCIYNGYGTMFLASAMRISLVVGFFIWLICGILLKVDEKEYNILKSGVDGEKRVTKVLSRLPDNYTVVHNVIVDYDGQMNELDFVVVGHNGVFVIENKNNSGTIKGDARYPELSQSKKFRRKMFRNPVKQVGIQVYRLKGLFNILGINQWIQPVVYFSNPEARVKINNCSIPIFTASDRKCNDIVNFIITYRSKNNISEIDEKKIISSIVYHSYQ